jgi:Ricin-type beta-trefoil lectin domain-like
MVKYSFLPGRKAEEIVPVKRWSRHVLRVAASTVAGCLAALSLTAAAAQADTYGTRITNIRSGLHADVMWASQNPLTGVFLWSTNSSLSQKFDLLDSGGGYFRIRAEHSGQCLMLDWRSGYNNNGTPIIQYPYCNAGYPPAEWRVGWIGNPVDNPLNTVLINRATGRCLDAANPSGNPPRQQAPLQQWDCHRYLTDWNAGNQEFTIG